MPKRCCCLIIAILVQYCAMAQEDAVELRIRQLEEQVRQLTDEVVELRSALHKQQQQVEQVSQKVEPPATLYQDVIDEFSAQYQPASYQKLYSNLKVGGYFEAVYENEEGEDQEFQLTFAAVQVHTKLRDWLGFHAEVVVENADEVLLSYAHLLFSFSDAFNLKAGVILVPFGHFNSHFYTPIDRELTSIPLVDQHIIPNIWGEPGVSLLGQVSIPGMDVSYEFLLSNGLGEGGFSFIDGNRDARQDFTEDNNDDKQLSGRIAFRPRLTPVFTIEVAGSGVIGEFDDAERNQFAAFAIDGVVKIGEFSLIGEHDYLEIIGEYTRFYIERDDRLEQLFPDISSGMHGYYVQLNYGFFPEQWRQTSVVFGAESTFVVAFRYESIDLDFGESGASQLDDQRIYTLGFNFRPIEKTVLKIEYNWIREFTTGQSSWHGRVLASVATYF